MWLNRKLVVNTEHVKCQLVESVLSLSLFTWSDIAQWLAAVSWLQGLRRGFQGFQGCGCGKDFQYLTLSKLMWPVLRIPRYIKEFSFRCFFSFDLRPSTLNPCDDGQVHYLHCINVIPETFGIQCHS